MMMDVQYGIVLRAPTSTYGSVWVFDRVRGKVLVREQGRQKFRVVQGALVQYRLHAYRGAFYGHGLRLFALPARAVQMDILFLHHVLEILYEFLSDQDPAEAVFTHALSLFDDVLVAMFPHPLYQQLFLVRLLSLMGVYPAEELFHNARVIRRLILHPLVTMVKHVDMVDSVQLSRWLNECLQAHPQAELFSTIMRWRAV